MSTRQVPARVERVSLRAQVRRILRMQILTGELEPGILHSVAEFVAVLGVSASPVREAVGDLEQRGLVQVIPNRGFVVPELTAHDLDEIFQLRTMLEVAAVERLCLLAPLPDDSLAACQQAAAQCIEAGRSRDVSEYVEADRTFHLRLTGMLGNERLNSIVDRVRDEIRLYGLLKVSRVDLVAFAQEHQALLDAVRAGDGIGAATVLRTHLSHTRAVWAASAAADSR